MSQELKLRITDVVGLEAKLLDKGAVLTAETDFVDTYFNQPTGKVLKIVEKKSGSFLNIFEAVNGKFEVVKDEQIKDPETTLQAYAAQFGIRRVLKGHRKFFQLGKFTLLFNLIDNVGDFLIVTSENPSQAFVETELGIENPEYITVSFDQLPEKQTS